ncbi:hypothetical protein [Olene mendosa nucleopolyhedrovirus]|uniref:Uncharacterized protein n=1 Tax=Olene mendosa nucleopolyhedrovirus TaxID=2933796 RepID=A0AAX3AU37_9ABAC|nr:hypothetical protein QKV28_gp007 [Olene mendosa nucleopolyhedrovirus]UOQ18790.1 hypothetical protein [Olene mendosa nucleopolyhedrovirus]
MSQRFNPYSVSAASCSRSESRSVSNDSASAGYNLRSRQVNAPECSRSESLNNKQESRQLVTPERSLSRTNSECSSHEPGLRTNPDRHSRMRASSEQSDSEDNTVSYSTSYQDYDVFNKMFELIMRNRFSNSDEVGDKFDIFDHIFIIYILRKKIVKLNTIVDTQTNKIRHREESDIYFEELRHHYTNNYTFKFPNLIALRYDYQIAALIEWCYFINSKCDAIEKDPKLKNSEFRGMFIDLFTSTVIMFLNKMKCFYIINDDDKN